MGGFPWRQGGNWNANIPDLQISRQGYFGELNTGRHDDFITWGLAEILVEYPKARSAIELGNPHLRSENIRSKLSFGGFLCASYKTPSRPPQSDCREEKKKGEGNQKCVGDFEPIAIERRPELGSLLASLLGFALAFPISAIGGDLWDAGKRLCGGCCLMFAIVLGFQSTFGLLLGFDLWSL